MAIAKSMMKFIIVQNGHLRLEGDETSEELRMALIHLRGHFPAECQKPGLGIPIEKLLPDITVLTPAKRGRPRSVNTAAIRTDVL